MPALTFSDLREIGTSGPFNMAKLKFGVFLHSDGSYHFNSNHSDREKSYKRNYGMVLKSAPETFQKLSDCCARRKEWDYTVDNSWGYRNSEMSASYAITLRKRVLRSLTLSQRLEQKSANAREIFKALEDYYAHADRDLGYDLTTNEGFSLGWEKSYGLAWEKELAKIAKLFKTQDSSALLSEFAKRAIGEKPKSIDPSITKVNVKANQEVRKRLTDPTSQYLVHTLEHNVKDQPWSRAICDLYPLEHSSFRVLPLAVAERFAQAGMIRPGGTAKLSEPLDTSTLEALNVLYKPQESGPYSNLDVALKAAKLL